MTYGGDQARVEVVESFGVLEIEYAAIRKGTALIDLPHRGTIRVEGSDRLEFLNRMVTQELKGFEPPGVRRSFWLNRKGRIDADLRMIALPDAMLLDCEILSVRRTIEGLNAYLFAEDVRIEDATEQMHRLALHGPRAGAVLAAVSTHESGDAIQGLHPDRVCVATIGGERTIIDRSDTAGETGYEVLVSADGAAKVYRALAGVEGVMPIGWHAYNIARIEAGTPVFGIDFGTTSLPHETGVLNDRVSFKKGCYLGQEVVARMQSLGHPKQIIVGLRVDDAPEQATDQPVTGSPIYEGEKVVGAVSSCTRSPMLGDAIIALAPVKWDAAKAGNEVRVEFAGGGRRRGVVQEKLRFWSHTNGADGTAPESAQSRRSG